MSSPRSHRSAGSTSDLNAPVCGSCSKPKLTSGDGVSSNGIGPTCGCLMTSGLCDPKETPVPIFSAGGSPAKTSVLLANEQGLPGNDPACSLSSHGSQMSFDPDGSSSRTSWDCSPHKTAGISEPFFTRWPTSGTASAGGFSTLDSSEFPSAAVECSLSDILEGTVDRRYALSARAARGILRRADARGRALPAALLRALQGLSAAIPDPEATASEQS